MNRRYLIAGGAVAAVAVGWFMFGGSGGGSSSGSSGGGSVAAAPVTANPNAGAAAAATGIATQLYGNLTGTTPPAPSGTLVTLTTFGRPRDGFVQIAGNASPNSSSLTFGSTSTSTKTAPITLGSGTPTAIPSSGSTPSGSSQGGSGTPTTPVHSSTTPTGQTLAAEFDINGEPVVGYLQDEIPPETQQFTVQAITPSQVTLGLNGALLASGASSVTVKVGQTVTLNNQTAHTTTVIHLISVHSA
jgi:hypothetical protein